MIKFNDYVDLHTENEMAVIMQYVCGADPSSIYGNKYIKANILFIKCDEKKKENIIIASRIFKENDDDEKIKKEYVVLNNIGTPKKYDKQIVQTSKYQTLHFWEVDDFSPIFEFDEKKEKVYISKEFFNETDPEPLAFTLVYANKSKFREFEFKIGLANNVYSINDPCKSGRHSGYVHDLLARRLE